MLAAFFTKVLQGELFRFFRSIIMGWTTILDVVAVNDEMKKRVEKWSKYENKLISSLKDQTKNENVRTGKYCDNNDVIVPTYVHKDTNNKENANDVDINKDINNNNKNHMAVPNDPTYADVARRGINIWVKSSLI